MKTRILSAAAGLAVLAVFFWFFDGYLLNLGLAAVAALAVFELLRAVNLSKTYGLALPCIVFCEVVLLFSIYPGDTLYSVLIYLLVLAVMFCALVSHGTIPMKDCIFAVCVTLAVTFSFQSFLTMRDDYGVPAGKFYFILILAEAWLSDAGAYFAGSFFGKHKLCPRISPKKTVEGLIGGIIVGMAGSFALVWLFQILHPELVINTARVLLVSPVLVALSVCGDLVASILKRQCGIKDYGNIMPGHGGAMDRFDSVLPVASAVYLISVILPLVSAA